MLRIPLTLPYSNGFTGEEIVEPSVIIPSGNYRIINVWGAEGHGLGSNSSQSLCILNACVLYPGGGILIPPGQSNGKKKKRVILPYLFFFLMGEKAFCFS